MTTYDNHIGEFIKEKLREKGIRQSAIAEKMGMSRQNFSKTILDKHELLNSQVLQLKEILGIDFFDEFGGKSADSLPKVNEGSADYGKVKGGKGFKIFIEVDPENFDSSDADKLSLGIQELLEKFK